MVLTFILLQFLNIIISTFKSVLLIKGTKAHAALINAISYSLAIIITYVVSNEISIYYSIPITFILNLVGVYIGLTILEKLRKDQLWRISTTIKTEYLEDYIQALRAEGVQLMPYETGRHDYSVVDVFSNNREETSRIQPIIKKYEVKYTILKNSYEL